LPQQIYIHKEELYGRHEVISHVQKLKQRTNNFTLIDIGASHNPFSPDLLTHTFDLRPNNLTDKHSFLGDINQYEDWQQIFDYVDQNGKFTFCNCTHTLEDIAYPMAALRYMPRIAEQGFIAVPSKYYELQYREEFKGAIHHRWIFDHKNNKLIGYPKINLIETLTYFPYGKLIEENAETELRLFWKDTIDFEIINNDYLGPTREAVIDLYKNLMP